MIDKNYVLQLVLSKLKVIRVVNGEYYCICPCHSDTNPSLHVSLGEKKVILHCKADCDYKSILDAIGMQENQLYYDYYERNNRQRVSKNQYWLEHNATRYDYHRIDTLQYDCTKWRKPNKVFEWGTYRENEYIRSTKENSINRHTLSVFCNGRIKALKDAIGNGTLICYTEGEKDCLTLWNNGYVAFTFGGVHTFKDEILPYLKGGNFLVFADNDKQGITDAEQITQKLNTAGQARMIVPSEVPKGDISDYMQEHTKEELQALINATMQAEDKHIDKPQEQIDLMQFHLVTENGKITGVYHNSIFEHIKGRYNIFVCGGTPYIYCNGYYKADISGARLKSIIRSLIYPQFVKSTTINNIYALFLQDITIEKSFEELNSYPAYWICFENGMYDCRTKQLLPHNPKYLCINQIPHKYVPGTKCNGRMIEEYLNFICEEQDSREMLLQFIGYSLTKDVAQQKFLVLNGEGGTGKSTVIRLIEALTGSSNVSNISLTDLQQRFASFGLMGKLLNSCADLEISALEDTSIIKKILGEDTLRAEQKGRDAISFKSYAKLIFSTNELPLVKSEKTNGFYRRLLVLTMNKVPLQKNPNLFQELLTEIDYLLHLSVQALERMYQQGTITVSEASEKAVLQLRADSDTTEAFLQEYCVVDEKGRIERTELYNKYNAFCEDTDRQSLTKNNFYKAMRTKGYSEIKTNGYRYFKGILYEEKCPKTAPQTALDGFMNITQEQLNELPFD